MLNTFAAGDAELAAALEIARRARVTVHVRGTNSRPVIECLEKGTRRVVGGSELKRRLTAVENRV